MRINGIIGGNQTKLIEKKIDGKSLQKPALKKIESKPSSEASPSAEKLMAIADKVSLSSEADPQAALDAFHPLDADRVSKLTSF